MTTKAVILARGLGTRMRQADERTKLTAEQERLAAEGVKAMMPVGRPFLDYVLSALADGGIREVCIVVGRDENVIRRRYHHELTLMRLRIAFAIQEAPTGTADAVLAAQEFSGGESFLVLNADNYYSSNAYRRLAALNDNGLVGFDRRALVQQGNIDPERIKQYALLRVSADGVLEDLVEKPDEAAFAAFGEHALVSMNLWSFTPAIFEACRRIPRSSRGEFELPEAVRLAVRELGMRFHVVPLAEGVLDLATRADVVTVAERLRGVSVHL